MNLIGLVVVSIFVLQFIQGKESKIRSYSSNSNAMGTGRGLESTSAIAGAPANDDHRD